MIISIKKRDGRVVPFDPSKIEHAIAHCFMGSGSQKSDETAQELAALVVSQLENDENIPSVPSVEQVQDVVERVLIEKGFPHHGAVAFGHFGKSLYEVFKYVGVDVREIDYNQPAGVRYPTENPFA